MNRGFPFGDRMLRTVEIKIVPIQVHDREAARGLIDAQWITQPKRERGVDIFIPLKRNMDATRSAIAMADYFGKSALF